MKKFICCLTIFFCTPPSAAPQTQTPLTLVLRVSDAAGHFRQLTLGVHQQASYEFEDTFDEILVPPIPPVPVFDARFVDLPGRRRSVGTGSETDIREFSSLSQVDTFLVRFQCAEGSLPLRLEWSADIRDKCDSLRMEYVADDTLRSLQATTIASFELLDDSTTWLRLILFGPHWTSRDNR